METGNVNTEMKGSKGYFRKNGKWVLCHQFFGMLPKGEKFVSGLELTTIQDFFKLDLPSTAR